MWNTERKYIYDILYLDKTPYKLTTKQNNKFKTWILTQFAKAEKTNRTHIRKKQQRQQQKVVNMQNRCNVEQITTTLSFHKYFRGNGIGSLYDVDSLHTLDESSVIHLILVISRWMQICVCDKRY